jgi:thiosulfate dehydrogenase (quinone) large subunit
MDNKHIAIADPPLARALFTEPRFAWIWLILRVYVGWQWLTEGIDKAQTPGWAGAQAGAFLTTWVTRAITKTQ